MLYAASLCFMMKSGICHGYSPPRKRHKITESIGLCSLVAPPNDAIRRVNIKLLHCPDCSKTAGSSNQTSEISPIGVLEERYLFIECNNCNADWCLCMQCGVKQRSQIRTMRQLKDHRNNNSQNHTTTIQPAFDVTTEEQQNDNEVVMGEDDADSISDDHDSANIEWIDVVNSNSLGFDGNKMAASYFEQCYLSKSMTAGMKYLVMRSSRRSELEASEYVSEDLPPGHAALQTRIANLAFVLTRGQTESLVSVLQGAYKVGCENGFHCSQVRVMKEIEKITPDIRGAMPALEKLKTGLQIDFSHDLVDRGAFNWSTRVPEDWNDVRQMYLEGARAIVKNLPIPTIKQDVPDHSYVSVSECIRHFLAHRGLSDLAIIPPNLDEMKLDEVYHSSVSVRAKEILQSTGIKSLSSYILFWSDDVEPNRIKSNRGSVWLLTATIATHLHNGHLLANTFPIAVGRKGDDHDPIVAKVEESMQELRGSRCPPFYIGRQMKKVKIVFETFCTLQDQPERRDFNSMRAGNGATTGRFGVSADHSALYNKNVLPSCASCLKEMESALLNNSFPWPMKTCDKCVRWDALDDRNGLAFWLAHKDYPDTPRVEYINSRKCLRPFRISYDSLKQAVDIAHSGYVDKGWSNQNCESFLENEGMSTKYINIVMEHCARSYSLKVAKNTPQKYASILKDAKENPTKYAKAPYPSPWSRPTVALELHPDVIMHLIFLGIVKTTVTQIQNCLSAQSKLASFLKSTENYLKELQTMTVEWIAIQPYQAGKMGGWVSENYLGFSRILPWFFQNIAEAVELSTDFLPPEGLPQNKWLHRHNKYWLQIRGLNAKGNRTELKERVAETISKGAPEPLPAPEIPTASIEAVLLALMEVLQCVMAKTVTPTLVNHTRYAVRVFLSQYDSLCRPLRQKTPAVLSSYNFICLLNLPDVMERFGPLRCIWEGGPRGEGFVRFGKPLMTQGLRQNWHQQLLQKMHRAIAFESVLQSDQQQKEQVGLNNKDTLRECKGMFHLYKTAFDVRQHFSLTRGLGERNPVSVVLVEEKGAVSLFAVVRDYDSILQIVMNEQPPIQHFGFHYYTFAIPENENDGIKWLEVAADVTKMEFGMLLPLLKADDADNRFALIVSNWRTLSPSLTLSGLLE